MTLEANPIPLFKIDWDQSDISNAIESITRGSYWAKGPFVSEFESNLENVLNVKHALVVNSGTTALVAALKALEIGRGDEVIVPSFTFIATANAVRLVGAEPVFADIEADTYGLDPDHVRSQITDKTAAILPVHCYGTSCRIDKLCEIADKHNLYLLEDAAEALGAEYRGQKLGTFGDIGVLSFCQNKIVATGEGGAVITDDDDIAQRIRLYRSHGRVSENYFESASSGQYADVGTNIRMGDLPAAIGCSQLDRLPDLITGRQRVASQYTEKFENLEGVHPHTPMREATHVHQLYTIELGNTVNRSNVIETLADRNISSKVYWDPAVHGTSYYKESKETIPNLPVTEETSQQVLSLPMHPNLSSCEITRVVNAVKDAIQ
ncbi:glutamine--scyllo-inositol transaminase [Natrialba magadii ATCC 43099]|uniref:Glutamine--scyllo-inositol transaminase n=1 Tax=Natrialba magadii (strain ATCC 43099 / DSM 3394 / CCM 3739 / CIP 104546 / IAM 13178 / JCM 8861 / NBRC 102185 / NCIMB 2190 / MS3) TaxID=547559 RepID=D3SWE6_NATMM|nr:DegT/DnrJ/EryC1/StrS family aminotransferase [Natrialba magadii]ADD03738.1 glutamine--scyllo-inositol transaminase [Natrialba magadii ATCC 43099]ELY33794.1 glutamine--scyllo-inositol transaminase [Natrialba magadii ATCC 43099]